VWLSPWTQYLSQKGVQFHSDSTVKAFKTNAGSITGVTIESTGQLTDITADFYIAALPVEIMAGLVTDEMKALAPSLAHLADLRTAWMNGIQFFLKQDVPVDFGHTLYADSPWALTSISQRQFWHQANLANYGNGQVGGILSADISDWETPGILYGKPAMQCTAQEIKEEAWAQIKVHLNVAGAEPICDENLITWFLDSDIQFPNPSTATNLEPLLINTANSLQCRPNADTEIPNLLLASDYVRTYTDLACMEAANEAARRAANAILTKTNSTQTPASVWPMQEPDCFKPLIEYDRLRFRMGLPHTSLGLI
jgi:uncharacterized protein with NAD-binding domain and iron-sulfur cluster